MGFKSKLLMIVVVLVGTSVAGDVFDVASRPIIKPVVDIVLGLFGV
jgi:hypothetical protein